jgi:hypothetical protein
MSKVVQLKQPTRRQVIDPEAVSEVTASVPIPPAKKAAKYPIATLKVGESFSVPATARVAMRVYIYNTRKTHPARQFTIRSESDDESRIRVWRIK